MLTNFYFLEKDDDEESADGPTSISTPLKWKEGKDLIKLLHFNNPARKNRKRNMELKTFFFWFTDNSDAVNDEIAEVR